MLRRRLTGKEDSVVVFRQPYSMDGCWTFEPFGESFDIRDGFWKGVRISLFAYTLGDTPGEPHLSRCENIIANIGFFS